MPKNPILYHHDVAAITQLLKTHITSVYRTWDLSQPRWSLTYSIANVFGRALAPPLMQEMPEIYCIAKFQLSKVPAGIGQYYIIPIGYTRWRGSIRRYIAPACRRTRQCALPLSGGLDWMIYHLDNILLLADYERTPCVSLFTLLSAVPGWTYAAPDTGWSAHVQILPVSQRLAS